MKKILLASTALVAMSVSAAHADLSISGSYEFGYIQNNTSGTNATTSDGNITFNSTSTADNGITYSVVGNYGIQNMGVEDVYLQMDGDFGTVILGETDSMLDRNDGALGKSNFSWGNFTTPETAINMGAGNEDTAAIHFQSNELVAGLKVYGTVIPDAKSGFGVTYTNDLATITYQSAGGGGTDETMVAAGINVAGFGLNAGSKNSTTGGVKTTSSDFAVSYSINGVTLTGGSLKSGTDDFKMIGAAYSVAPGVGLVVESFEEEGTTNETGTGVWLTVSF